MQSSASSRGLWNDAAIRPVHANATAWFEGNYVAEFFPTVNVQTPNADALPIVGLTPHALVTTLSISANNRVESPCEPVSLEFSHEVRDNVRYRQRFNLITLEPPFWQRRRDHVSRWPHWLFVQGSVKSAHPPEYDRPETDIRCNSL